MSDAVLKGLSAGPAAQPPAAPPRPSPGMIERVKAWRPSMRMLLLLVLLGAALSGAFTYYLLREPQRPTSKTVVLGWSVHDHDQPLPIREALPRPF